MANLEARIRQAIRLKYSDLIPEVPAKDPRGPIKLRPAKPNEKGVEIGQVSVDGVIYIVARSRSDGDVIWTAAT